MTEKKLEELLKECESERENTTDKGYYSDAFPRLKNFIIKKLGNPMFRNKNAKIIVDHFDEILPFIVMENIDILLLNSSVLIDQPNFKEKFVAGLKKYPYKDSIGRLIYNMWLSLNDKQDKLNQLLDDNVLKTIASFDVSYFVYLDILNKVDEERQRSFLNILVENKADIPYLSIEYKGNNKQIIFDNLPLFMENAQNLYTLMNFVKEDPVALAKVKEYIDSHEDKAINSIFCETDHLVRIKDETLKGVIELLVKDVMKNENAKYSDIAYNGGGFSRVLLVGDKVIKLGSRFTKSFPNNPYIIAPLLRKEIESGGESCFIEVTERVNTDKNISREELYELYKNLRDLGLVWTDIKMDNVGRLNKENIIHWNQELNPSEEVLGLESKRGKVILKEGDLVILDADFIFDENDPKINYCGNEHICAEYEERYKNEKNEVKIH